MPKCIKMPVSAEIGLSNSSQLQIVKPQQISTAAFCPCDKHPDSIWGKMRAYHIKEWALMLCLHMGSNKLWEHVELVLNTAFLEIMSQIESLLSQQAFIEHWSQFYKVKMCIACKSIFVLPMTIVALLLQVYGDYLCVLQICYLMFAFSGTIHIVVPCFWICVVFLCTFAHDHDYSVLSWTYIIWWLFKDISNQNGCGESNCHGFL